jgi:hypothetical protein
VIDLAEKIVGVLAALLGLAGYVLIVGGAILWLRLSEVDLPPEVPVSLAAREELIVLGAEAVAVWLLLVSSLVGLAAWIVTGDPARRKFGYAEAAFALAMTLSTLLALSEHQYELLSLPGAAATIAVIGALAAWPSLEGVGAALLPALVGTAIAVVLALLGNGNDLAPAAGASGIFLVLVLGTPYLQEWRSKQEANQAAIAQLQQEGRDKEQALTPLLSALEQGGGRSRPKAVVWIGRVALGAVTLLLIGVVAVATQLDRDQNFHKALVSLANGDCLQGTYLVRGNEQVVIAQPNLTREDSRARIVAVPVKEVLEFQIYASRSEGEELARDEECKQSHDDRLVAPVPKEAE